jgi:hypothetical protein
VLYNHILRLTLFFARSFPSEASDLPLIPTCSLSLPDASQLNRGRLVGDLRPFYLGRIYGCLAASGVLSENNKRVYYSGTRADNLFDMITHCHTASLTQAVKSWFYTPQNALQ